MAEIVTQWPDGNGEMAALIRDFAWSVTPLGPTVVWSERLKVMVEQVLANPFVSSLACGPERVLIYNDAAAKLYGDRHPVALGRPLPESFPEGWATVAPFYERAFAGETIKVAGQPLDTRGEGEATDVFDALLTPVREADGHVAFVHMTGSEVGARTRVEAVLRESEARHRLLIASWAQTVWETNAAGVVVTDSPSWRAYTGQTVEEWLGYGWLDAIHPDDRAYAERQWREAIAAHGLVNAEFRLRAPDGGWRWTNVRAAPVLDAGGHIEKWAGMNIDIDARRRAESALRESEERYRSLFESMDEAYAVVEVIKDKDGKWVDFRFLDANRAFVEHTSMPYPVGKTATELLGSPNPRWTELYGQALDTGQPIRIEETEPTLDRTFDLNIFTLDRVRNRVAVLFTNITARKKAEVSIRESDKRQGFLLKLSDSLRAARDYQATASAALQLLTERLDLDRCYIASIRGADQPVDIVAENSCKGLVPMPAQLRPSDFPEGFQKAAEGILIVDDIWHRPDFSDLDRRSLDGIALTAFIVAPLHRGAEGMIWALVAGSAKPRRWTNDEAALMAEAAERTWSFMERARSEAALRESEERFQQFATAAAAGLWIRDANTMMMEFASPAVATIYGVDEHSLLRDVTRWAAMIVPEDRDEALRHLDEARAGEVAVHEFRIQRPSDGAFRWIRNTDFPLRDGDRIPRIGGISDDVTEAKLANEHSAVLLAELQHRVRNIMAVIRAITARTGERAESVPEYAEAMAGRLMTLARVQTLLTRAANAGVGITGIVRDELSAKAQHKGQYTFDGPDLVLAPKAAEVLTLAIHELTTNALKYGGLSVPDGHVTVRWTTVEKRGTSWLVLDWIEEGAPERPPLDLPVPRRRGFGSELIEGRIPYELGGRGKVDIGSGGARCRLEFPLRDGDSILETDAPQRATVFGGALDMAGEADLSGHRVLVIEDDFYLATDAARALRGAGAVVVGPCPNEEVAREELEQQRPDAAVVDINLGRGPSFKLAAALRDRGIPFVFTTGYDLEVIPAEFDSVQRLQKPVQLHQIVSAVAQLLGRAA